MTCPQHSYASCRWGAVFWLMVMLAVLARVPRAFGAGETLHMLNFTDYTSKDMLAKFTAETGVNVEVDTFDNNETLLSKLGNGSQGYDIAVAANDFLEILKSQNLIQKINAATLPGYENLDDQWKHIPWDPGNAYSIPWQIGITSFSVDTAVYKGPADSLKLLFEPPESLRGRIGMFSSPSEVVELALVYLGKPACSDNNADLHAVDALLRNQIPYVKVYNSTGNLDRAASGETIVSQIANGEAARARFRKPSLKFVFAKEGGVAWVDSIIVPITAARPDLARRFISFFMNPKNAAMETVAGGYPTGIRGADQYLPKQFAEAPELHVPTGFKAVFAPACSESAIRKYNIIWTRLRR